MMPLDIARMWMAHLYPRGVSRELLEHLCAQKPDLPMRRMAMLALTSIERSLPTSRAATAASARQT